MLNSVEFSKNQIDEIKNISKEEKNFRIKNLELFNSTGFPNKRHEDWKFSDLKDIINKNFANLNSINLKKNQENIKPLLDFEHNYILLLNGNLHSQNFDHEDNSKIKLESYCEHDLKTETNKNPLVFLNNAFSNSGYYLEIEKNYKFNKVLVIYNFFSKDLKNEILNSKNKIKINEGSELHLIEYIVNESENKFINNLYENIILEKNSKFRTIYIQNKKSNGYFYKFIKNQILNDANYTNLIFSSGFKFNKIEIDCDLSGENSECNIQSALFLKKEEHQEIKTRLNHLVPNCKSYQKIKQVLSNETKGIYQGKIYVKDIAQKTNAYQLSKALLLSENSEFNSKPELEIYADDVKCSHGSTSGNIDEESIYYLMSRGLNKKQATNLLIKGFLLDVVECIKSTSIKKFIDLKLESQINEY
ncbi:MAG: Fe-S cluster assembly protein SufD [Candidatus Pelagibacter sp. TMED64]|nr:Fe-S cluster assembly protein SufD [Candidatus Pelagibacter sp.]OUU67583.1 MAG: Fe-S cluster assembly protein SufD [Candidatus Pelagibacter sp. TMED64]